MSLEGDEEEEESSCGSPKSVAKQWNKLLPLMNLLDEYWFFHNTLHSSRRALVPQRPLPLPDNKSKEMSLIIMSSNDEHIKAEKSSAGDSFADRAPLRGRKETAIDEEHDEELVDVTRSSTSSSTPNNNKKPPLLRAPSMPSPQNSFNYFDGSSSSSPKKNLMRNASTGRHRVPRHMRRCCCTNLHYNNYKRAFREKKWRSSSDLESIEVQGFKDLGFVFDEAGLNDERLASVIPGLREKKAQADDGNGDGSGSSNVERPYLSETWNVAQRSAPPTLIWAAAADKRSAADMKEQLKFWATAVAYSVRPEC